MRIIFSNAKNVKLNTDIKEHADSGMRACMWTGVSVRVWVAGMDTGGTSELDGDRVGSDSILSVSVLLRAPAIL